MKNILITVLVLVLGGFGYYQYHQNQILKQQKSVPQEQVTNNLTNTVIDAAWKSLSSDDLFKIIDNDKSLYFEKSFGIQFVNTLDLTGDGLHEGIFGGNGGNNGLSFILSKNTDGSTFIAKQKNKNGSIATVGLFSVGRVMVSESFDFLPEENGFYTVSKSYNEKTEKFVCNENGVNAYKWNNQTKLFEWNQSLTVKYTGQVCK